MADRDLQYRKPAHKNAVWFFSKSQSIFQKWPVVAPPFFCHQMITAHLNHTFLFLRYRCSPYLFLHGVLLGRSQHKSYHLLIDSRSVLALAYSFKYRLIYPASCRVLLSQSGGITIFSKLSSGIHRVFNLLYRCLYHFIEGPSFLVFATIMLQYRHTGFP